MYREANLSGLSPSSAQRAAAAAAGSVAATAAAAARKASRTSAMLTDASILQAGVAARIASAAASVAASHTLSATAASDAAGTDHERRTGAASAAADCAQVSVRGQISHIEQRVVGSNASASLRPSAAPRSAQLGSSRGVGFSGGGGGGSGGDDDYMAPPRDDEDAMQPLQQPFVYDARDAQNFRRNPYAAANLAFARIGAFDDSLSGRVMYTSTHPTTTETFINAITHTQNKHTKNISSKEIPHKFSNRQLPIANGDAIRRSTDTDRPGLGRSRAA